MADIGNFLNNIFLVRIAGIPPNWFIVILFIAALVLNLITLNDHLLVGFKRTLKQLRRTFNGYLFVNFCNVCCITAYMGKNDDTAVFFMMMQALWLTALKTSYDNIKLQKLLDQIKK